MAVCFSFSCFSCYFEGVHFLIFICNYLYIRYLYRYKKECIPHFLIETTETERLIVLSLHCLH